MVAPKPNMDDRGHIPVLVDEVLSILAPKPGEVFLDCTAGLGGHAAAIAARLGPSGTVILNDLDAANLAHAEARIKSLPSAPKVFALHGSFVEAPRKLAAGGLVANCILADLGFASNQVDDPSRGLAFSREGPLDMRLNPLTGRSAKDLVNTLTEAELARIIAEFGEERFARRVALRIVEARRIQPIETTSQLADIIRSAVPRTTNSDGSRGIDPATRTFQALRMAVNDELGHLAAFLDAVSDAATGFKGAPKWLAPGARVAIITFHSLEDRPVKQSFADLTRRDVATDLSRKPLVAGDEETRRNPRARSAKLRAIQLVSRA